jgi:hypothetical protein
MVDTGDSVISPRSEGRAAIADRDAERDRSGNGMTDLQPYCGN